MRRSLAAFLMIAFLFGFLANLGLGEDEATENGAALEGESPETALSELPPVDFTRDIRPLLSDRCFACHGPDEESLEGNLRLDHKESVFGEETDSGEIPIVSGDPDSSELIYRILSDDEDEQMPPSDLEKRLTDDEKELIRRWVAEGASWEEHWAYVAPERAELPQVSNPDWCRTPIDRFILARLDAERLSPSVEAEKETLLRRVTFDLTGLPPTLEEVDAFLTDESPEAYERVVDRLLASSSYGEHMARYWLDAARYGDTHGLHNDNYREMWLYRDWVVRAYNNNLPFDQFTIEQLAGDLLENPTTEQIVASGFNRCNVTTAEGGSIKEEVYVRNVVDRVVTTNIVFMAATFDCTRCHDHKYDPYTMKDFYGEFAFFNSFEMDAMDGNNQAHAPVIQAMDPESLEKIEAAKQEISQVEEAISRLLSDVEYSDPMTADDIQELEANDFVWFEDEPPTGATLVGWNPSVAPSPVLSGEKAISLTAAGNQQQFFHAASETLLLHEGDTLFTYVYLDPENPPQQIMLQWNDGNWEHRAYWGESKVPYGQEGTASRIHMGDLPALGQWVRLEVAVEKVNLLPGAMLNGWAFTQFDGTVYWDKAGVRTISPRESYVSFVEWETHMRTRMAPATPNDIAAIITLETEARTEAQSDQLLGYFFQHVYPVTKEQVKEQQAQIVAAHAQIVELEKMRATTLISRERAQPRPSYLLIRGEYNEKVEVEGGGFLEIPRSTPSFLPPLPEGAPVNRLGFAQWLVDPSHPLTARVQVNRLWQQVYGTGIVESSGDFGSQGTPPSHPKLLDWLAVEFIESGWDVKAMMKIIVMSSTYRQSSVVTPELLERDVNNRLLARGPRFRLDAEMIRDQALAVSGLLVEKLGGPSVKPPQPDGIWFVVGMPSSNTNRFVADEGPEKVHRRTLYTFIKRTAPPPQMSILDAPSRETCTVQRERTNTPLGALMLMNDPQYIEAARALAARTLDEGGDTLESKADYMYRLCTSRHADAIIVGRLLSAQRNMLALFEESPESARILASSAEASEADAERAAWVMVANIVLNLDEVLNKN